MLRKSKLRGVIFSLALVGFIALLLWFKEQVNIDKCLDSGGRWSYGNGVCEM